jgi:hypothetical protein
VGLRCQRRARRGARSVTVISPHQPCVGGG